MFRVSALLSTLHPITKELTVEQFYSGAQSATATDKDNEKTRETARVRVTWTRLLEKFSKASALLTRLYITTMELIFGKLSERAKRHVDARGSPSLPSKASGW